MECKLEAGGKAAPRTNKGRLLSCVVVVIVQLKRAVILRGRTHREKDVADVAVFNVQGVEILDKN